MKVIIAGEVSSFSLLRNEFTVLDTDTLISSTVNIRDITDVSDYPSLIVSDNGDILGVNSTTGVAFDACGWEWVCNAYNVQYRGIDISFLVRGGSLMYVLDGVRVTTLIEGSNLSSRGTHIVFVEALEIGFAIHFDLQYRSFTVVIDKDLNPLGVCVDGIISYSSCVCTDTIRSFVAKKELLCGAGWWSGLVG